MMKLFKSELAVHSAAIVALFAARRMLELAEMAHNNTAVIAAKTAIKAIEAISASRN